MNQKTLQVRNSKDTHGSVTHQVEAESIEGGCTVFPKIKIFATIRSWVNWFVELAFRRAGGSTDTGCDWREIQQQHNHQTNQWQRKDPNCPVATTTAMYREDVQYRDGHREVKSLLEIDDDDEWCRVRLAGPQGGVRVLPSIDLATSQSRCVSRNARLCDVPAV